MTSLTALMLGPGFTLCALVVLGAGRRFDSADRPDRRRPSAGADADDYGLLRPVALVDDLDVGQAVRALLVAGEVRATVATGRDGLVRVLVFPDEYARACRLVSWVL